MIIVLLFADSGNDKVILYIALKAESEQQAIIWFDYKFLKNEDIWYRL